MDGLALGFGPIWLVVNKEGRQMSPTLVRITEKSVRKQTTWYIYHVDLIGKNTFSCYNEFVTVQKSSGSARSKFRWLKVSADPSRKGKPASIFASPFLYQVSFKDFKDVYVFCLVLNSHIPNTFFFYLCRLFIHAIVIQSLISLSNWTCSWRPLLQNSWSLKI